MSRSAHNVFNFAYEGIARELRSHATLIDPMSGKKIQIERAIWDTGATNSAISTDVALRLGAAITGQANVSTANGDAVVNTYVISLVLPGNMVRIDRLNVSDGNIGRDDMLIGMDVIGIGDFTVQNHNGKTHYSFCFPPFEKKYDMIEKANKIHGRRK